MHGVVGNDAVHELWKRFSQVADGFPAEVVKHASASMLLGVMRQAKRNRAAALDDLDALHAKMRELLAGHYFETGERRNVFPFTQNISVDFVNFKTKWPKV
jgi:hypothetical protein